MIKNFNICLGIFIALAVTRFIPHPPNFTSLIALSFYVPALFGVRYLPIVIISFILTDVFIGFHNTIFFTWGSVIIVGLLSNFFNRSIMFRILGVLTGVMFFYLITNFGVWLGGMYGSSFNGLITSYIMGLPFLGYNLISTFIFSALIESFYKFYKVKVKNI
tara:strand:- start:81 stop:566 length:486 start_codon:yes stop_codon:yes gene_type:complete